MNITFVPFDKKKEKTSLRAFVYHRGQEYRISVGESILTKYWSENKNRCKLVREYPDGAVINKNLDDIEGIITTIIKIYGLVTPTEFQVWKDFKNYRRDMNINAGGVVDDKSQNFIDYAIKFKNESDRKNSSKRCYETTIRKLQEYEKKRNVTLRFIDINVSFYNDFKKWLLGNTYIKKGTEYHYAKNYIGVIMFKTSQHL
jgi:hypothetical protein